MCRPPPSGRPQVYSAPHSDSKHYVPPFAPHQVALFSDSGAEPLASSSACGGGTMRETTNQDRAVAAWPMHDEATLLGVFDGHGADGHLVASFVSHALSLATPNHARPTTPTPNLSLARTSAQVSERLAGLLHGSASRDLSHELQEVHELLRAAAVPSRSSGAAPTRRRHPAPGRSHRPRPQQQTRAGSRLHGCGHPLAARYASSGRLGARGRPRRGTPTVALFCCPPATAYTGY